MIIIDIIFVISLIIILLANIIIRHISKELREIPNKTKLSGFEVAKILSNKLAKEEPHIIKKHGKYLDHYNYERNVIKLSDEVFDGENVYSAIVAITVALETDSEKSKIAKSHKFTAIMVLIAYSIIILGAILSNYLFIRFGFIIFIIALIIEVLVLNLYARTEEDIDKLWDFINKNKVLEPFEENKEYMSIFLITSIARLPYSFINYFR